MPAQGPGLRKNEVTATKAVLHGDPVIEGNVPGIAFKNKQLDAYVDPSATAARQIAIGEVFTIMIGGVVEVRAAVITGGLAAAPAGTRLWIDPTDNTLEPAVNEDGVKFGVVHSVDTARGIAHVNTNLRDSF